MPGFFADECVGRAIVEGLVDRGLDVLDASVVCKDEDDERVLSLAAAAGRIVITSDWGFGEMTVRHRRPAVGVIILSLYAYPPMRASALQLRRSLRSPIRSRVIS